MTLPWEEPGWLGEVSEWIGKQVEVIGPIEERHRQAWSAMLDVPTADGTLFFKAGAPSLAFEAGLTDALTHWAPACTVGLVASDTDRGWLLMTHSGVTLRSEIMKDPDVPVLPALFARYAELQLASITRVDLLLGMGVPDRRWDVIRERGTSLGVEPELIDRLIADVLVVPLPDTLVHEEPHDANVLLRNGDVVFIDWADSCVGHPFFGVVVALRSLSDRLELEPGAPRLEALVDAYLDRWTDFATPEQLRSVFPSAYRLGMLNRAISWQAGMADVDEATKAEHQEYVDAWLEEFSAAVDPKPGT
jgi:hypothetical protein